MKNIIKLILSVSMLSVLGQCKPKANSVSTTANVKTFIVASQTADCTGIAPMKCLQVKEKQSDRWGNFYSNIEGFTYEPGFEYILKVKTEKITNTPADASSIKYILLKQVSKIKK
nr:DUF4377 domain-containing protein [uncultured Chryseobacterium sp.]